MKRLLFLLAFCFAIGQLHAQDTAIESQEKTPRFQKTVNFVQNFNVTATFGSGYYSDQLSQMGRLSIGELSVQYKVNPRFSFGIGMLGSVLCEDYYYDEEGNITEDEDDDDDYEEDNYEDDDDDECEDELGENLMGLFTYRMSENFPLFLQLGGGYSWNADAPVYSILLGYNQKVFQNFGILAGLRYSDAVNMGDLKNFVEPIGGLKAELGVSWNF